MKRSIFVGYDPREQDAFNVCVASIRAHLSQDIPMYAVALPALIKNGHYYRKTERRGAGLWDVISRAPMSTEFAISRFLVPWLAHSAGLDGAALFMDCDMLVRTDLVHLFSLFRADCAVQVVKHRHEPVDGFKMDGQRQTAYPRKNWSSVMLLNTEHPAHRFLTVEAVNTLPGRALHGFIWLADKEIGALPGGWNHLVGVDAPDPDAMIAHFTLGIPSMKGYEECEFADEWRAVGAATQIAA